MSIAEALLAATQLIRVASEVRGFVTELQDNRISEAEFEEKMKTVRLSLVQTEEAWQEMEEQDATRGVSSSDSL